MPAQAASTRFNVCRHCHGLKTEESFHRPHTGVTGRTSYSGSIGHWPRHCETAAGHSANIGSSLGRADARAAVYRSRTGVFSAGQKNISAWTLTARPARRAGQGRWCGTRPIRGRRWRATLYGECIFFRREIGEAVAARRRPVKCVAMKMHNPFCVGLVAR